MKINTSSNFNSNSGAGMQGTSDMNSGANANVESPHGSTGVYVEQTNVVHVSQGKTEGGNTELNSNAGYGYGNQGAGAYNGEGGNMGENMGMSVQVQGEVNMSGGVSFAINRDIKLLDRNHSTYLFVGIPYQSNDHTVFGCKHGGFETQNFQPRTSFVITSLNNGKYQIMDRDHQAYLFVGNDIDNGGDRTVYACSQQNWKDHNDFLHRTAFFIETSELGGHRIRDANHNSYIFIGNSNKGGDHTLFSVPVEKFNNNRNEWAIRTVFELQ